MRLFFALRPAPGAAGLLAELGETITRDHGGRAVPVHKVHLTLVFLGEVDGDRVAAALDAARQAPFAPFRAVFDRVGGFRRSGVAWVGMSRPPAELLALQERLGAGLRSRGFVLETRVFVPHVTLARKVARPVAGARIAPIEWEVRDLELVRTEPGSGDYATIARIEPGLT